MPIQFREIEVTSTIGAVKAQLVVCPDCGTAEFVIYYLVGHEAAPHLQCVKCGTSFCQDGTCGK